MVTIYIYVLDTLADWELAHIVSELNSGRFFKEDAKKVEIKTVSFSKKPIRTMGGIKIEPDCLVHEIEINKSSVLLLPGADTWKSSEHAPILRIANELLSLGATVCAICGATTALAEYGILDNRSHTSNGKGFLEMFSPNYKGQHFYIDEQAVLYDNLITASSTGTLLWTKYIIECLNVFQSDTLEAWFQYFSTGESKYFFSLMQSLPVPQSK